MRTLVSPGVYQDSETGSLLRRTWRSVLETPAPTTARTVSELIELYLAAGAPTLRGKQYRNTAALKSSLKRIQRAFTWRHPDSLTLADCIAYGEGRGADRSADVELQALSGAFNWACQRGLASRNPIKSRFRVQASEDVSHCRDAMPSDGDELHQIARALLEHPLSKATGWQMLFEAFTGLRTGEILGLRMDAAGRTDPGWVEGSYLYVRRSKSGQFPFVPIHSALRTLLEWHRAWWTEEGNGSPWYFPGRDLTRPLGASALTRRLRDVCPRLGLPHRTSHGMRAYFVTVLRSQGRPDAEVAALIGDRTVGLIQSTYGALPEVWAGGEPLDFMPKNGAPAWRAAG